MSKIFRLKEWVTIPDAAKYISQFLNEPVTVPDILQMALDGHLQISVDFPNRAKARLGRIVPFKEVPMRELPTLVDGKTVNYPAGMLIDHIKPGENISEDARFVCFSDEIVSIDGIWDLSMVGNERIDIEFDLQRQIGGPEVTMINIDGTFLNRADGTWAALQEQFPDESVVGDDGVKRKIKGTYYPAGGLGEDCTRVIRTSEIFDFQARLDGKKTDKLLSTSERTAYLNIVAAMLELLKNPRPGRVDDASVIRELVENYSDKYGISESNLNRKFPEAKRSLSAS